MLCHLVWKLYRFRWRDLVSISIRVPGSIQCQNQRGYVAPSSVKIKEGLWRHLVSKSKRVCGAILCRNQRGSVVPSTGKNREVCAVPFGGPPMHQSVGIFSDYILQGLITSSFSNPSMPWRHPVDTTDIGSGST